VQYFAPPATGQNAEAVRPTRQARGRSRPTLHG
jgi:hypothetical protein